MQRACANAYMLLAPDKHKHNIYTGPKLRFPTCPAYQNRTFPTLIWQRIGRNLCKQMKCMEYLALSYRMIERPESKFLSPALLYDSVEQPASLDAYMN